MMKKILIVGLVVVVLLVVVVGVVTAIGVTQFDRIVKEGIERGGTYATGVQTTTETVDVSLSDRTFDMTGFKLDNPAGFDTPHFMSLADTGVQVTDLSTKQVTLSTLTLTGIDLYLDKGGTPSNYNTVLESLKRFESEPVEDPFRVVIDSLVIEDVDVHLANMPGVAMLAGDVAVNIPRIELRDVGKDEPMGYGEVIALVVKTVLAASVEAGGGIIPDDVLGELTGGLGSLESLSDMGIEAVGEIGRQIEEQFGGVLDQTRQTGEDLRRQTEEASESVQDAADRVRGIFGGREEEEQPAEQPSEQP